MSALLIFRDKRTLPSGAIVEMRIWQVPSPVPPAEHLFKYSLFYGRNGQRLVGYDNERGKGDHRHLGDLEFPYQFKTVEQLIRDFLADVAASGEVEI